MGLVEQSDDLVTGLETVDFAPYRFDGTGSVRGGNDLVSLGEGVLSLGSYGGGSYQTLHFRYSTEDADVDSPWQ